MAIYIYKNVGGALVSWCPNDTDPVADDATLTAQRMSKVSGLAPLDAGHVWDETQRTVLAVTPPPIPNEIRTSRFVMLFTPREHNAIWTSTDQQVQQFVAAVGAYQVIDLNDPTVVSNMNYIVSLGLLTQANANLILSNQPSL